MDAPVSPPVAEHFHGEQFDEIATVLRSAPAGEMLDSRRARTPQADSSSVVAADVSPAAGIRALPYDAFVTKRRCWVGAAVCAAMLSSCSADAPQPEDADSGGGAQPSAPAATAAAPKPTSPMFLTPEDVRKQPGGSARAALYEFWFLVQYREMSRAYARLSQNFKKSFAGSLRHFQIYVMADHPRWLAKPTVLFDRGTATRKTLAVLYKRPQGVAEREAVTFMRENGAWKLDYSFYLANRLIAK